MAIARFTRLCLDAEDPDRVGGFWARILDLAWRPDGNGEGGVYGGGPQPVIWVNRVTEPKTVKHRVHLDMYTSSLDELAALGSPVLLPEADGRRWTVMADPEGGEYCAFLRAEPPAERLHGVVIDCADPAAQARWWAAVLGGTVVDDDRGFSFIENTPGTTFTLDFVPEPKAGKNRVHWDLAVPDPQQLVDHGARVLRKPGGDVRWHVMADPEGNEFCAFRDAGPGSG